MVNRCTSASSNAPSACIRATLTWAAYQSEQNAQAARQQLLQQLPAQSRQDLATGPDPQAQSLWHQFITQAGKSSQDCERALDHMNGGLFDASLQKLTGEVDPMSISTRITAVMRAGGL